MDASFLVVQENSRGKINKNSTEWKKKYMKASNFVNLYPLIILQIKCILRDKFQILNREKIHILYKSQFAFKVDKLLKYHRPFLAICHRNTNKRDQKNYAQTEQTDIFYAEGGKKNIWIMSERMKKCDRNDKTSLKLMVNSLLSFPSTDSKILF